MTMKLNQRLLKIRFNTALLCWAEPEADVLINGEYTAVTVRLEYYFPVKCASQSEPQSISCGF